MSEMSLTTLKIRPYINNLIASIISIFILSPLAASFYLSETNIKKSSMLYTS